MAIRVYRVAVVGCPRAIISSNGLYEGAGKSCLCNKFVRSESYVESHNTCLSENQWLNEPVTNGDHFIYWGAATKHLPDGSKARFQVVEQTELYSTADHTLQAHPSSQDYLTRASATHFKSSSGGKTAVKYKSVESGIRRIRGPTRNTQLFPNEDFAEKGLGVYGYVCVFDPSLEGKQMENQLSYWSVLMPLLAKRKRKIVIACVKCDTVDEVKITFANSVVSHVLKKPVPFVEVSARESVNVEEAFFAIANPAKKHKVPKNGKRPLSGYITFNKVLESRKGDLNRAKDAYRSLLQKRVTHFSTTWNEVWPSLEREAVYRTVLELAGAEGEEMVLKMFQLRLIEIKLSEASKLHGHSASKMVNKGSSRTYQDYLSSAFKGHPDLGSESLYDYVYSPRSSISDMSDVLTEPSPPSSYRNTPDLHNSRSNMHLSNLTLSDMRPRSSTFQEPSNHNAELFPSSTLPRTPPRNKTHSVDLGTPQGQYTVEDPPPLPPRAIDVFASSQLKILSQSHSFMGMIPEATSTQESDTRRLSNSMDCLLVDSDTDSVVKKKRFDELVAEPYLHPVEVKEMMSLTPTLPLLTSPSPKPTDTAKSASIFMSMRVRTKSRPALPKQTTVDNVQGSPVLAKSFSFQKGHKRSRSNPWVLEGSRTKPPELPPRNIEAATPLPIVPPTPTTVSTSSSVFSEAVMSPIETSLEFGVRPPLPPMPRSNAVRSPAMLKSKKTSEEGTDELGQSEGEGLEVSESPSPRRHIIDDEDDDDDPDDPSNQYARIEDMQKYVLMSSAPASTLPKATSATNAGEDTVDFSRRSQTMVRPHKDLPSTTSAPLLPWKRKWKKQRDAPIIHDPTPAPAPPTATLPVQSPSHSKRVSRPLPPSPTKPRKMLSNKGTGGNIYEAIDDYRRQGGSKKQDHLWGPPVEARLVTKYVEAVRRLFTLPDVKERWLNTLTSLMPEENIENIPHPFAAGGDERDPGSEHSTPSPQPKLRHKSSISTADDVIIIQQPNPVTPIHSSFAASSSTHSSFAASPPTHSSFAASPPMSPFRNPPQSIRVASPLIQSPNQSHFKKSSSRDDLIQILNQQLNNDSLSSDSDSDDESSSSDEDSDIEPPPVVKATTPLMQTDLDEALSLRASVSTDSDLATPPANNGVEIVNNVRPSMLIKKRGTSKRRNFYPSTIEATRNLSDSGISNCHSQTFEDGFSSAQSSLAQHNSESEC